MRNKFYLEITRFICFNFINKYRLLNKRYFNFLFIIIFYIFFIIKIFKYLYINFSTIYKI